MEIWNQQDGSLDKGALVKLDLIPWTNLVDGERSFLPASF